MFSGSNIISDSIKKGGAAKITLLNPRPLNTNQSLPAILSLKQAQEFAESTKSILAGSDRVLKALEKMQSTPEYIKVSKIDAKYPGYMHLYYNTSKQTRLRVEKEMNIDVNLV